MLSLDADDDDDAAAAAAVAITHVQSGVQIFNTNFDFESSNFSSSRGLQDKNYT